MAAAAHEGEGPSQATLKRLFPSADNFVTRPLSLTAEAQAKVQARLSRKLEAHDLKSKVYVPTKDGKSLGVVWVTDAHFKEGLADVVVGLDLQGKVAGVGLEHSPVALLAQSNYLNQYKKLNARSVFLQGKDLKPLPSNPAASSLLAAAVRKAVAVIDAAYLGGK